MVLHRRIGVCNGDTFESLVSGQSSRVEEDLEIHHIVNDYLVDRVQDSSENGLGKDLLGSQHQGCPPSSGWHQQQS